MTISEKVAYLKGLADGLDLDLENSKEGKLLVKIIDILEDLGLAVEDLEVEVQAAVKKCLKKNERREYYSIYTHGKFII